MIFRHSKFFRVNCIKFFTIETLSPRQGALLSHTLETHGFPTFEDSLPSSTGDQMFSRPHSCSIPTETSPRQESNLHPLLRTELFYPLNYEGYFLTWATITYYHYPVNFMGLFYGYFMLLFQGMTPEEKAQLNEVLELSQKNNKILRKLQGSMKWSRFFRFVYWVIIIGSAIGTFYFVQPYLDKITVAYNSLQSTVSNLPNLSNLPGLKK